MQFPLSQHCFDEELSVQQEIYEFVKKLSDGNEIDNYTFVKSETNTLVQLSDIVAGLFGRMFSFFNQHEKGEFRTIVSGLTDTQLINLCELQKLREKSDNRNKGLLYSITAIGMLMKINLFFDYAHAEMLKRQC